MFTGVKVFSATMREDRDRLGDLVTNWIAKQSAKPGFGIVDIIQSQSSDSSFHMVSIVVFFVEENRESLAGSIKRPTPNGGTVRRLEFKELR